MVSVNAKNGKPSSKAKKRNKKNGQNEIPSRFYGVPLPGVKLEELSGTLFVLEGTDGSGRSTQISLLTEWLESEGFAVQTMGLRRSFLVADDIDTLLAESDIVSLHAPLTDQTSRMIDALMLTHTAVPSLRR